MTTKRKSALKITEMEVSYEIRNVSIDCKEQIIDYTVTETFASEHKYAKLLWEERKAPFNKDRKITEFFHMLETVN